MGRYIFFAILISLGSGCASHTIHPPRATSRATENYEYQVIKNQTYIARPNQAGLQGDLYVPEGKGPFPGILVVHGGSWSGRSRSDMRSISEKLARHGFVAFNISYRFAPEHRFPSQLHDLRAAIRWMRLNAGTYKINADKIGGFGYSAGAHLISLAATADSNVAKDETLSSDQSKISTRLQAIVAGGTPADLTLEPDSKAVIQFLGANYAANPRLYEQASPFFHVSADDPPAFLYHGKADTTVKTEQTIRFAEALKKAGVQVETYLVPVLGHITTFVLNSGSINRAVDFLEHNLRPGF